MDIFAHALWTGATYKTVKNKTKKNFNVWLASFWGIFPDLFAFTILFAVLFWNLVFGGMSSSGFPHPDAVEPVASATMSVFKLTPMLYNISHSLVTFSLVFGIVFLIARRPVWELGGWLIHILIDIPTHSYQFYPTPFLWPISDLKFNGFSWGATWFMLLNYTALIVVYLLFRKKKTKDIIKITNNS